MGASPVTEKSPLIGKEYKHISALASALCAGNGRNPQQKSLSVIYKIVHDSLWQEAQRRGRFDGAAVDLMDGYIHFSAGHQVEETARRHFVHEDGLLLVAFEATHLGPALKWEAARGGDLFPHLYGPLDPALAQWARPLPWNGTRHVFPANWRA
jgi:uncharacterized protein (DUF952 family)